MSSNLKRCGFVFLVFLISGSVFAQTEQASQRRDNPMWRFESANDVFFGTDNQFTNGWNIQKHSALAESIDQLHGVPGFGRSLARWALPEGEGLHYRNALVVGQNMSTPEDIENENIILDDLPYHGLLAAEGAWIAFNDSRFTGFAVTAGLVGEYSLAEFVQTSVHSLIGSTDPNGWDHQLDHEPVLNFSYLKKRKLWNTPWFDGALAMDLALGNYHTGVSVGLEMQIGRKPGGFSFSPDAIGRGMHYDATLGREDGKAEFYGTLTARVWAWALFMPLEGNIFRDDNEWTENNTLDPEQVVPQVLVGFHYVKPRWGLHLNFVIQGDNVDRGTIAEDIENDFGMITFDYRFK